MEIKHLKYKEIDFEKYDACIKNAINTRVYAYSWYLDVVCNKDWEVLILDNYKVVMPLPFKRIKRKFLRRMIEQPMFCQQLGVFYPSKISKIQFELFINKVATLNYNTYNFNADNSDFLVNRNHYNERVNYELNLNNTYEEIQSNYSKNLKRNINKAKKNNITLSNNLTSEVFIKFINKNSNYNFKTNHLKTIANLINSLKNKNYGKIYTAYRNDEIIATAFFVNTENRLIYLFSAVSNVGKKHGAIALIFEELIKNHATSKNVLDFEGSMISGVARFFKSFGANEFNYFSYKCFT